VTGYEPPEEDPSEAPTGYYDYSGQDQGDVEGGAPWYRKPIILVALVLFAAMLLGVALYVFADRTRGSGNSKQTPTSPTTSTGVATTTTTGLPTTTTEPVAPAPTTTMTFAPTTTAPATTPPASTTIDEGHHHHHHHDGGTP
jgi:hypothetical protein